MKLGETSGILVLWHDRFLEMGRGDATPALSGAGHAGLPVSSSSIKEPCSPARALEGRPSWAVS